MDVNLDRTGAPLDIHPDRVRGERGQTIVLFALIFLGLLAFTALAVDAGFAFARSSQFSRAVDSAALAGVVDLSPTSNMTTEADLRAAQFLAANGWPTPTLTLFASSRSLTVDGIPQYTLTATWQIDTFFIQLVGIDIVTVQHAATAAFYAQAEIYTPTAFEDARLKKAAQFLFGGDGCTREGDPVIPIQSISGLTNEDYNRFEGFYRYRIVIPDVYSPTHVQVELFDPDSHNIQNNDATVTHTRAVTLTGTFSDTEVITCPGSPGLGQRCYVETGELRGVDNQNPFWFQRVDESWDSSCNPSTTTAQGDTVTVFELFYFDDNGQRVPLAQYTADGSQAANTDLRWVTPCDDVGCAVQSDSGDFEVDVSLGGGIPRDDRGRVILHLDVTSTGGSSKNVWDIYARPNDAWYAYYGFDAPESDVNARNVQIANGSLLYNNEGILVYALGRMPLEHYYIGDQEMELEVMPLDRRAGGGTVYAMLFDMDPKDFLGNPVPPPTVTYTVDTLPKSIFRIEAKTVFAPQVPDPTQFEATCESIGGIYCDNSWMQPQYRMFITDDPSVGFAGGNLFATYAPDADATTFSLSITAGRPFLTK